jgi:hypothetical protein
MRLLASFMTFMMMPIPIDHRPPDPIHAGRWCSRRAMLMISPLDVGDGTALPAVAYASWFHERDASGRSSLHLPAS